MCTVLYISRFGIVGIGIHCSLIRLGRGRGRRQSVEEIVQLLDVHTFDHNEREQEQLYNHILALLLCSFH